MLRFPSPYQPIVLEKWKTKTKQKKKQEKKETIHHLQRRKYCNLQTHDVILLAPIVLN